MKRKRKEESFNTQALLEQSRKLFRVAQNLKKEGDNEALRVFLAAGTKIMEVCIAREVSQETCITTHC